MTATPTPSLSRGSRCADAVGSDHVWPLSAPARPDGSLADSSGLHARHYQPLVDIDAITASTHITARVFDATSATPSGEFHHDDA